MIKIAVKELAYFTCQTGNLTPEFFTNKDETIGKKMHQYLQSKYNSKSKAEYFIKKDFSYNNKDIRLQGFIDGVLNIDEEIIIEEIKSTNKELDEINYDDRKEHLAQAKLYAYLYSIENNIDPIKLRLTYISTIDYETKSFDFICSLDELEEFTFTLLEDYLLWIKQLEDAQINKEKTIETIKFPYELMRPGQRDMMKACFQAMRDKEILYCIAPTGIGKTIATMFSSSSWAIMR